MTYDLFFFPKKQKEWVRNVIMEMKKGIWIIGELYKVWQLLN